MGTPILQVRHPFVTPGWESLFDLPGRCGMTRATRWTRGSWFTTHDPIRMGTSLHSGCPPRRCGSRQRLPALRGNLGSSAGDPGWELGLVVEKGAGSKEKGVQNKRQNMGGRSLHGEQ